MAEAPPCTPSSWSDIPPDIAGLVLGLLPAHADLARFAAVCPKWRAAAWSAAARQLCLLPPLPVIALPDGFFYSLPRGERFRFPDCGGRYHSTCGNWLVFSRDDGFFLVDPFSNATMTLPGLSCFQPRWEADDEPVVDVDTPTWMEIMEIKDPKELAMHKLIVCSPHLVAALVGFPDCGANQIVVCRPGASSWSVGAHDPFMRLRGIGMAFHQGELYALDFNNNLLAVDISVDHSTGDPWVSGIRLVIKAKVMCWDGPMDSKSRLRSNSRRPLECLSIASTIAILIHGGKSSSRRRPCDPLFTSWDLCSISWLRTYQGNSAFLFLRPSCVNLLASSTELNLIYAAGLLACFPLFRYRLNIVWRK